MKYGIISASEWLYPDEELSSLQTITLNAAKGGSAGFQLKLTETEKDAPIEISAVENVLPAEIFRCVDVNVNRNTGRTGFTWTEASGDPSDYVTRIAPFRVYDALRPFESGKETANGKADGFFININVPRNAQKGTYELKFTVEAGKEKLSFAVLMNVYEVALPEKETLLVTNWFSTGYMASRHNLEEWSEEHWEMIRKYGEAMRRARQNVFWVQKGLIGITKKDGVYSFDFSKAGRLIEMYFDLGFTLIEGGQIAYRKSWEAPELYVHDGENEYVASSKEAYAFLSAYLGAWKKFLEENGWYDRYIQHISDEPNEVCKENYFRLACIVRRFLPGIQIIEAVEIPDLEGAVDIWVPKNYYYEDHKEQYETFRAAGDTLWYYTCCFPGGKYLNRQLDKPLIQVRYLHWGNFRFDMPGFLHWGFNHFYPFQDPFEDTAPLHGIGNTVYLPSGDTNIVYPGNGFPMSSMRLENHRYGAEDYELFRLLEKKNPALAKELCDSMIRTFSDVDENTVDMEEVRVKLLTALEK